MSDTILHSLTQEVKSLYLKTSIREIEDQFLVLAEAYGLTVDQWLRTPVGDRVSLQDPEVLGAIQFLVELRKKYPMKVSPSEMSFYFVSNPKSAQALSYLMAFSKVIGMPGTEFLDPYKDIIQSTSHFTGGLDLDEAHVLTDLQYLEDDFTAQTEASSSKKDDDEPAYYPKLTKKQQQASTFGYLLRMFSGEIASAADANGLDALASDVRSGSLARLPDAGIGKYVTMPSINDNQWNLVKKMANYVVKSSDERMQSYNHDLVEMTFLTAAGQMKKEDMLRFVEKVEESKDFTSYLEDDSFEEPSFKVDHGIEIVNDQRLNPIFLYMLNGFLILLYREIDPR